MYLGAWMIKAAWAALKGKIQKAKIKNESKKWKVLNFEL